MIIIEGCRITGLLPSPNLIIECLLFVCRAVINWIRPLRRPRWRLAAHLGDALGASVAREPERFSLMEGVLRAVTWMGACRG